MQQKLANSNPQSQKIADFHPQKLEITNHIPEKTGSASPCLSAGTRQETAQNTQNVSSN
jgi:hypothetical protein